MRWLLTYPEDGPSVRHYEAWVRAAGAEPVLVTPDYAPPGDLAGFDALLLPGGGDVDPARYGEKSHARTYGVLPARDALEIKLIAAFEALGRPVFGICRGLQILNVARGGGLIQHVPEVVDPARERHSRETAYDAMHGLAVDPATRLGAALRDARDTNSAHHQAADPSRLGRGLRIAAWSGAGIVEALEDARGYPVFAVQWHPERLPPDHAASHALRLWWSSLATT